MRFPCGISITSLCRNCFLFSISKYPNSDTDRQSDQPENYVVHITDADPNNQLKKLDQNRPAREIADPQLPSSEAAGKDTRVDEKPDIQPAVAKRPKGNSCRANNYLSYCIILS